MRLSNRQCRLLNVADNRSRSRTNQCHLQQQVEISESVIRTLIKNCIVAEFEEDIRRDPLAQAEFPEIEDFKLTDAQAAALQSIEEPLKRQAFASILLHGVTGSGKTEIYIR